MHLRPPHTYLLAILFDFLLVVGFEEGAQVTELLFDKIQHPPYFLKSPVPRTLCISHQLRRWHSGHAFIF